MTHISIQNHHHHYLPPPAPNLTLPKTAARSSSKSAALVNSPQVSANIRILPVAPWASPHACYKSYMEIKKLEYWIIVTCDCESERANGRGASERTREERASGREKFERSIVRRAGKQAHSLETQPFITNDNEIIDFETGTHVFTLHTFMTKGSLTARQATSATPFALSASNCAK